MKIVLISPYEEFGDLFEAIVRRRRNENPPLPRWFEFEVRDCFDQAEIKNLKLDCDVVIARGGSARLLEAIPGSPPVVSISAQAVDMIRCIKKTIALYGKRRIIFPGSRGMVHQAYQIPELIDVDLEILEMPFVDNSEVERVFAKISDREAIIIGGTLVCSWGKEHGYLTALIESGEEAMELALDEACRIALAARREAEKAQQIKTILDGYDDAIISVDSTGALNYFNSAAERMLGRSRDGVLGRSVSEVGLGEPLESFITKHADCRDELIRRTGPGGGAYDLSASKRSVLFGSDAIGSVITLQYISNLQDSEARLRTKLAAREHRAKHRFFEILGTAPATLFAVQQAQRYSQADASVLITGRSGTGKELFAQSMHNASRRKNFPFVAINCAAIPESLLESELFGYVEGAFTGAARGGKAGLIETAHRGTIFLDEISELPLALQARLLRVLQEKEIRRLGSDRVINVDVRVFSATNRDLAELVAQGAFREDLYYRLDVLRLNLPPLCERRGDIPMLCRHYIALYAAQDDLTAPEFTPEAMELMCSLPWDGNIRELCNVCQRLVVLGGGAKISEALVAEATHRASRHPKSPEQAEVEHMIAAGLPRSEIARRLGVDRTTLWRRMKKWGVE